MITIDNKHSVSELASANFFELDFSRNYRVGFYQTPSSNAGLGFCSHTGLFRLAAYNVDQPARLIDFQCSFHSFSMRWG